MSSSQAISKVDLNNKLLCTLKQIVRKIIYTTDDE